MEWLERMDARKGKKGGAQKALQEQAEHGDDEIMFAEENSDEDADEDGRLILPDAEAQGAKKVFDTVAVDKLQKNPALDGAIPLAIFDISRKQPFFNSLVAEQFFNVFAGFSKVASQPKIIQHVLDSMTEQYPNAPATCNCFIKQPLNGVEIHSVSYPKALREALARLKTAMETTTDKVQLASKTAAWIETTLSSEDLDTSIRTILEYTTRTLPKA
jgi:U3 small nucleolar RNA-associated protein 6